MNEEWKLWDPPVKKISDSLLLRYGIAMVITLLATLLTFRISAFGEAPFFIFTAAATLSALCGGLGPGFFSIGLSALLISFFFIPRYYSLSFGGNMEIEDAVRMAGFLLVSLMVSSLVAGCRRERNSLRDSEERYRVLAETAPDAIVIVDEQSVILFVNPLAETIFGASAREMLGHKLSRFISETICDACLAEMRRNFDTRQKAKPVELSGRHMSGREISLETTFGAFSKHGKNVFTAIIRDVTNRKSANTALAPLAV